jgi:hypothetical protein
MRPPVSRLACPALLLALLCAASAFHPARARDAAARLGRHVILVSTDGLRPQEVFNGADELLLTKAYGGISDTNAARGTALQAAKAAAASGDLIRVSAGVYDTADLLKNGVRYHFETGASVVYTGASTVGIFDDNGTALTCEIGGDGIFTNAKASGQAASKRSAPGKSARNCGRRSWARRPGTRSPSQAVSDLPLYCMRAVGAA